MNRNYSIAVMYHYVRDVERTPFPEIKALAVADFEAQLDFLQSESEIVDYLFFNEVLRGKRSSDGPLALLTFDDGFIDHYDVAFPILRQRGISGVFFVAGATLLDQPRLLNVHKIHFLLARLGGERFSSLVQNELASMPEAGGLGDAIQDGVYRYDQREDGNVKYLLNYQLPFETADNLLNRLFEQLLGDASAFARDLYLSQEMICEMAGSGMTFGWHTENHRVLSRLTADE